MRRRMAALSSIAVAAGVAMAAAAATAHLLDEVQAGPAGTGPAPMHRFPGAVAMASGTVAVTAVAAAHADLEAGVVTAPRAERGLRLAHSGQGETALATWLDAARPIAGSVHGFDWGTGPAQDHGLRVDRAGVAPGLPTAVFALGAIIAALGLSPYRRPL